MGSRRSSFYSEEEVDELDVRIRRGRSPQPHAHQPAIYPEHRYRTAPRPFYETGQSSYLVPAVTTTRIHRSQSTGRRATPPAPPAPVAPVIINNRIYNDYEDDDYLDLAPKHRQRSHSRNRSASFAAARDPRDDYELDRARRELDAYKLAHSHEEYELEKARKDLERYKIHSTKEEYELEKTKMELQAFKLRQEREQEEQRLKKDLELQRYREGVKANASKEEYEYERQKRELEEYKHQKEREEEERRIKKDLELARLREGYKINANKEDFELEKTKKELAAFKAAQKAEEEEKRIKKEMEFERLRKEKKENEEKARLKKESDAAIEKYKLEEAEKAAKAKKEKEEREKEYQHRLEDDLRKSGMDERQIAVVLKKDTGVDPSRPTYTRMSRRHLSIETLNRYRIDYEFDQDPDYVLIKRWVPEYEQDFLWSHTREIRERRREQPVMMIEDRRHSEQSVLLLEAKKKPHHETEFELVRKKKHDRRPSPSPLLTFLAGGQRR